MLIYSIRYTKVWQKKKLMVICPKETCQWSFWTRKAVCSCSKCQTKFVASERAVEIPKPRTNTVVETAV